MCCGQVEATDRFVDMGQQQKTPMDSQQFGIEEMFSTINSRSFSIIMLQFRISSWCLSGFQWVLDAVKIWKRLLCIPFLLASNSWKCLLFFTHSWIWSLVLCIDFSVRIILHIEVYCDRFISIFYFTVLCNFCCWLYSNVVAKINIELKLWVSGFCLIYM